MARHPDRPERGIDSTTGSQTTYAQVIAVRRAFSPSGRTELTEHRPVRIHRQSAEMRASMQTERGHAIHPECAVAGTSRVQSLEDGFSVGSSLRVSSTTPLRPPMTTRLLAPMIGSTGSVDATTKRGADLRNQID